MILCLFVFFLIVNLDCINSQSHFQSCQVGSPDKCFGDTMNMLDVGTPNSDAGYILSKNGTDYDSCADLCTWHSDCYMASFRTDNRTCNLYKNVSFEHSTSPIIKLFLWFCCVSDNYDVANRCSGFWKYRSRSVSDNEMRSSDPLAEYKGIDLYDCQMRCLNNSICGAVNYLKQDVIKEDVISCQLIMEFPVESLVFVPKDGWNTFQWQCSERNSLPSPDRQCKSRVNHLSGFWTVQNQSVPFDPRLKHLIYFHTFDYMQCLNNCALYPNCRVAWYSLRSFFCILEADKVATCADVTPYNNYEFTTYVWKTCNKLHRKQIKDEHIQSSCRTLVDNRYIYIYPIKCGRLPTDLSNLHECWKNPTANRGTKFSSNLHCQLNQSFRVFDEFKTVQPTFEKFTKVSWLRVYTGYSTFWLVNTSDSNFITTSDDLCDVFDARIDVDFGEPLTIIKRTEWFASKSLGYEAPYSKKPVNNVIISNTEVPFCNCFTVEACSNVMRRIQLALQPAFNSIPYSFVVTGDGIVYEARGWNLQPAGVGGKYNTDSFLIALCGQYKTTPLAKSLRSVKKLIQQGVQMSKVSTLYTLYIYNDVRTRPYPYDGLRRVIELWPHYRGYINAICHPVSVITIVLSVLATLTFSILSIVIIQKLFHKIWHDKNCSLVKTFRIETMYGNLFNKSVEVLPQILLQSIYNINFEVTFISPVTSNVYFIEDLPQICKRSANKSDCSCRSSIFSMLDLHFFQCSIVNVCSIVNLSDLRRCSRTIVFIFQRHADLGKETLLILHLRQLKSFYGFISKLHQNKCLCDSVSLMRYTPSSESFDDGMSCKEETRVLDKMTRKNRYDLEQKYSFLVDSNNGLRHYT